MSTTRLMAVLAFGASSLATGASAAQQFEQGFVITGTNVSQTYTFDVDYAWDVSVYATERYRWYWNVEFPRQDGTWGKIVFSETGDLNADCGYDKMTCREVRDYADSFMSISSTRDVNHLYVTVENKVHNFMACDTSKEFVCGRTYGPLNLYVGFNGENIGGYSLTNNAVPEPSTWAMMILGFGLAGLGLRRRAGPLLA